MPASLWFRPRWVRGGLFTLAVALVVAVVTIGPLTPPQSVAAAPPPAPPMPTELEYVPADAAFFVYADVAQIWTSDLGKTFRNADKNLAKMAEVESAKILGTKLDDLQSVVLFFPKITAQDAESFGIVLTFAKAYDKDKLVGGMKTLLPKEPKVLTPSETVAVVLVGLDKYRKPVADPDGPLAGVLRAAGTRKHAVAIGATLANLPDEIRGDDVPAGLRPFQPILHSETVTATLDLGKAVTLDVRVKTKTKAGALNVEKSLAALTKLLSGELSSALPDLEKRAADDAGLKDLVTVLKAVLATAKGAKYQVNDTEAQMTVTLPLAGLPLASAYKTATGELTRAAAVQKSANNLKQIAISMHNYQDATGALPPAAVCDKKGKPQLSWRVLILPYIEQNELYKQFKLDEPWDSVNNKKLLAKMPPVYALPGAKPGSTETHYRVFVGKGAGFNWLLGGKLQNIADGTSNTLMCVTAATAVPWTKPDELEFDPEKDMTKLIGLVVNGKAQVAMFDGSVRTLSKIPSRKTLNALITASGGEVIGDDF